MQLANSCSHMILNVQLNCINFVNFALYFLYHYCLHCIVLHMFNVCSACWQGRGAAQMQILLMQQSKYTCRCKMQLFPWYFHLPCHSPIFSPAIRPCTIEDSAFTCAVNCTMGSSPAAELLHSALFSLLPCYFGMPNHHHFSSTYLGSLDNQHVCGLFCHT